MAGAALPAVGGPGRGRGSVVDGDIGDVVVARVVVTRVPLSALVLTLPPEALGGGRGGTDDAPAESGQGAAVLLEVAVVGVVSVMVLLRLLVRVTELGLHRGGGRGGREEGRWGGGHRVDGAPAARSSVLVSGEEGKVGDVAS